MKCCREPVTPEAAGSSPVDPARKRQGVIQINLADPFSFQKLAAHTFF